MFKFTKELVHRFIKSVSTQRQVAEFVTKQLSTHDINQALYAWPLWARASQLPPTGAWRQWLILAGRGFGKTRTGAEWVRSQAEQGLSQRIALVGPTTKDVRDVMIEGKSGLLAISPPWNRPKWKPSVGILKWKNGVVARAFSADEPDRLRGHQHDAVWCDELSSWRYAESWDMVMMGLRLGADPKAVITTTPKPIPLLKKVMNLPHTHLTRGSTFENEAHLAEGFLNQILSTYEGTRLGLQELYGELLEDVEGALWTEKMLVSARYNQPTPPDLIRIVVAVDPAVTVSASSDETGIIVAGVDGRGQGYVLADASGKHSPDAWVRLTHELYHRYQADRIVVEVNQGGDLVEKLLQVHQSHLPITKVRATRGKRTRAEPIAALYERGKIHHVGSFPKLEDQLKSYGAFGGLKSSPDRLDALVWALTHLILDQQPSTYKVWSL